ncbi:MAG: hypothetical protein ILP17_09545 [Lachnospiraceae bacterium]|nr:hypothetical protein [Lachnospiraceae bacterium]
MKHGFFKNGICYAYVGAYLLCVVFDILYLVKWIGYGEAGSASALFIPLMIVHLVFPILAIVWRKREKSPSGSMILLFVLGFFAFFSIMTAHTMTEYVYKSKNGTYDKTIDDFRNRATLTVTSESLRAGRWDSVITNTSEGRNLSPQLSFDPVPGAAYYVIYMVDESANNWVHWYAEVSDTSIEEGVNPGQYTGPYPPEGSGDHQYTIYVYAMTGKPGVSFDDTFPEFDEPWYAGDVLWTCLNILDGSKSPTLYGNVIEYGYISGTYSAD